MPNDHLGTSGAPALARSIKERIVMITIIIIRTTVWHTLPAAVRDGNRPLQGLKGTPQLARHSLAPARAPGR
jgi:hypothetical protein